VKSFKDERHDGQWPSHLPNAQSTSGLALSTSVLDERTISGQTLATGREVQIVSWTPCGDKFEPLPFPLGEVMSQLNTTDVGQDTGLDLRQKDDYEKENFEEARYSAMVDVDNPENWRTDKPCVRLRNIDRLLDPHQILGVYREILLGRTLGAAIANDYMGSGKVRDACKVIAIRIVGAECSDHRDNSRHCMGAEVTRCGRHWCDYPTEHICVKDGFDPRVACPFQHLFSIRCLCRLPPRHSFD
jgi:hypothetical protein